MTSPRARATTIIATALVAAVVVIGAAAPAARAATTVGVSQGGIWVRGSTTAEAVVLSATDDGYVVVASAGGVVTAAPSCNAAGDGLSVSCPIQPNELTVSMRGGDDRVDARGLTAGGKRFVFDLAEGDDELLGSPLADHVRPGPGADAVRTLGGSDEVRMQPDLGDDVVLGGGQPYDGVFLAAAGGEVAITVDALANDGDAVTEHDMIAGFRRYVFEGRRAAASFAGGPRSEWVGAAEATSSRLHGGGGDDRLFGSAFLSESVLDGGDGNDLLRNGSSMSGGEGDDELRNWTGGAEIGGIASGGPGDDSIEGVRVGRGGAGDDRLRDVTRAFGDSGADHFVAGCCSPELLAGGSGRDEFRIAAAAGDGPVRVACGLGHDIAFHRVQDEVLGCERATTG